MEMCVLCHTPQLVNTPTGSLALKVMIHEMHMGSNLPSVIAGKVFSLTETITQKSSTRLIRATRRVRKCHSQTNGVTQANAFFVGGQAQPGVPVTTT
jgi:hypothetical protein